MIKLSCTTHAHLRARQRNGWSRATTARMLERVFYAGVDATDCKGELRRYLATLPHDAAHQCARIYGEQVYLFSRNEPDEAALVTVYHLPASYRHAAHRALRSQHALAA